MRIVSACIARVCSSPLPGLDSVTYVSTEADEAYPIGKRGQYTPVQAYLAIDEIIKIAVTHGVNMIHPGKLRSAGMAKT